MICEVTEKTSPSLGRVEGEERAFGEGDNELAAGHLAQPLPGNSQARFRPSRGTCRYPQVH